MAPTIGQRAWISWMAVGLLAVVCTILAVLQYRWIGEIAGAEKDRLQDELQSRLNALGRTLNQDLQNAATALLPATAEVAIADKEAAYGARYLQWKDSHERIFRRIALAVPERAGALTLLNLNLDTGKFVRSEWPEGWSDMRNGLEQRMRGNPPVPGTFSGTVFEIPRFGPSRENRFGAESEWLVIEVDSQYVRDTLLPQLLNRFLGESGKLAFEAEVVDARNPSILIYSAAPSGKRADRGTPDATVALMDIRPAGFGGRGPGPGPGAGPPLNPNQGRWRLMVWNAGGSLEALVARTRARNLAISAALLLLLLAVVGTLLRLSRQAQQLAEAQMAFVAGVSHELRTPLTVIRTAAFNLKGKLATKPESVMRYGELIQAESERLQALVEQVLRFASQGAGQVLRSREPYSVNSLIEEGLQSSRARVEGSALILEKHIDRDLPLVLADGLAMRHALENLVENAIKYGVEGSNWIGVFASAVNGERGPAVEIRVVDHGPGIPPDEQKHIFEPFFRGQRAVRDQIHGTGLGLNLVKKIVEAHGGSIRVKSELMQGTEFVIRIPAAPPEMQNELTHSID